MVAGKKKIRWDKTALHDFKAAINYIRSRSAQNAENVKKDLLSRIGQLAAHPETGRPDKNKRDNVENYRAFELHHFRVSYLVKENEIIIARFRHTSMNPEPY